LKLYPKGYHETRGNISIGLSNFDFEKLLNKKDCICVKYFIYVRKLNENNYKENETYIIRYSYEDYSFFGCINVNSMNEHVFDNFIDRETLNNNIVDNNSFAIGVYISIYNENSMLKYV